MRTPDHGIDYINLAINASIWVSMLELALLKRRTLGATRSHTQLTGYINRVSPAVLMNHKRAHHDGGFLYRETGIDVEIDVYTQMQRYIDI